MTDLVPTVTTIAGRDDAVETALRAAHAQGRLLTPPETIRPTRLASGQIAVRVRVLVPAPARRSAGREVASAMSKALAFGVAVSLLAAALVAGLVLLIVETVDLSTLAAVGALVLVAVLLAARALTSGSEHDHPSGYGFHWTKCK